MTAAVAVTPAAAEVGSPLSFAATGFANTHAITLTVTLPAGAGGYADASTTSGGGAKTWSNEVTPESPGMLTYVITDGSSTVSGHVEVFSA